MDCEAIPLPDFYESYNDKDKYDHGLPFTPLLAANLLALKERVQELNKAGLILIDGGVGEGKTTLAVQIADFYQGKHITFSKQLAMGGNSFIRLAKNAYGEDLAVLIYDEAGDFSRRGALTKFNMHLNRFFETYRAYKMLVIVCLPDFNILDMQLFRNKIPRLLLHCHGRTQNSGQFSAFSLSRIAWLRYHMSKTPYAPHLAFAKQTPNFWGRFKDLPAARSRALAEYSTAAKLKTLAESHRKMENQMSLAEIAQKVGRSRPWVLMQLRIMKAKPVNRIANAHYYDNEVVGRLRNLVDKSKEPRIERDDE